jgi:hypothetical protein
MAKASDNVFPYLHVAPAAAPASPSAGSQRLFLDSADGNKLKRKDSSGTVTTIEGGSASGVLAYTSYNPGTLSSYTTTSTTVSDVDATNLAVTFTAPTSGKVLVTLSGVGGASGTANDNSLWALRESTTTIAGPSNAHAGNGSANSNLTMSFVITGLTGGSSYTYKWAWKSSVGTNTARLYAGTGIQAVMTVTALP